MLPVGNAIARVHLVGDAIVRVRLAGNRRAMAHLDGGGIVNQLVVRLAGNVTNPVLLGGDE